MKDLIIKTEKIDWRKLIPYQPDSLKKTTKERMEKLKLSLLNNGFAAPFYVWERDRKLYIIDGHHRKRAMDMLDKDGERLPEKVTANFLKIKTDREAKKLVIAFNSHYAELDKAGFVDFISDLNFDEITTEFEPFKMGFNFDQILQSESEKEPELPKIPQSKNGDIYELRNGKNVHRIVCGNSQADQPILMNGALADMIFTDPPYGVKIGDKNRMLNVFRKAGSNTRSIENDNKSAKDLFDYLRLIFIELKKHCSDRCSIYVCAPPGGDFGMMMMMKEAELPPRHHIIWKKSQPTFSMGRLDYDYQHEAIIYTWTKSHKFYGNGEHKTTVWEIKKPMKSAEHPTMKPVELVINAILNSSEKGMRVVDIFLGSGSTLIACEQSGRSCYGLELEPIYVDVAIQRWVNYTGVEKIKKNGKIIIWPKNVD